ncbi:GAF domain-containing protein [Pelomonas saccharophila]|jgi:GAF domain-containing protein|uniref:GAF domain-containing protein n=1 Tax=Roseateles saccharophilus TaxID=304 RepID=A0ABU1YLG8_ROSSA|nr:GAF domain-containing protein [Roseateles saccharophilus]MDR7269700.1 GAF domain-containing protein [Roseateles saccharophilus]
MLPAPIPANDAERLRVLRELLVLDTPPEERFDRIVSFAAEEFDMPIALISLIDERRQWFKARVGLDACETSREISFCGHAILQSELFEVLDAALDPRFADNPLVTGAPFIRFYIGAPLALPGGAIIGTLCLIDTKPRHFDMLDRAILGTLRDLVVAELIGDDEKKEGQA